jgi:CheY-like chemotaxis protein
VLTTSSEPADIERCYELGVNSFVTKPLDFSEFSDVFAKVSTYWLTINQSV